MNVTGKNNVGFDPGSVNMQQAQLGTSLNMFGGAKGGDPSKMDASSLMGGSSGMMSGANSVMSTGGSSGRSTGGSSGGGMNLNPMNMMSSMMGGSGSGSGSGSGTNPMNAMMGGTSGTSRGANSGSASQTGGQTGGNPLDPLGAMTDKLRDAIERPSNRSNAIPPHIQVMTTLRILAKGDYLSEVADLHGISIASASRVVHSVCAAICERIQNIKFPREEAEQRRVKEMFYDISSFQMCWVPLMGR
ncbi:unnamed protein product [Mytilus coruscus]|uniref:HARBI1 n=1 Tax=Mytilus coruscus TaxID=42192 RepID=A0A6J8CY50_MYTCO|nr:unnamed protein product [Mytilus coruscus]